MKEDVKSKPKIKISFGRKDDKRNVVYVKRQIGDEPATILAIPDPYFETPPMPPPSMPNQPPPMRQAVHITQRVTGGYLAYRDHTLPSFALNAASKLVYVRLGETYEVEKEEKKDEKGGVTPTWLLKKPVEGKTQNVDMLLNMLLNLQITPETLITDRPTERDVKEKFGLDKPILKAVVTVKEKDNKTSEFTYVVGKKSDADGGNANNYFARLEKKPAEGEPPDTNQFVFLLPPDVVQTIDAELRDGTVFADETGVKPDEAIFTWRGVDKDKKPTETKLELTFADKKSWTVKSLTVNGKDAKGDLPKLDAGKVEQLLGTAPPRFAGPRLSPLTTQRFLIQNGKPDPAKGLDPASKEKPPALVVEIKLDNKSSRTLIIGDRWEPKETDSPGLAGRAYYYATASTLPNATFLLTEVEFKELVSGVSFFKAAEPKVSMR
jgi:hypothetical protein